MQKQLSFRSLLFAFGTLLLLCFALTACAVKNPAPEHATVTGTALYRERIMLPPDAELTIRLLDVSLADAPAKTLGVQVIPSPGNPPYAFSVAYDPAEIDPRHTYSVAADIRVNGKLLFITDTHYSVITRGASNTAELVLIKVQ
ncbi:YbaY family lipoprotein [Oleidesulfovibrio sp.]|uniref:YbaY family lipoprotein n=1 Tax=Oleidesulfovibrio sp. TaxID=2909707 RepID=UPI003A87939F